MDICGIAPGWPPFRTMMEDVRDVHTKGGRMWLFEALNEARHAARDCGVDEKAAGIGAAPCGLLLYQLVHGLWLFMVGN